MKRLWPTHTENLFRALEILMVARADGTIESSIDAGKFISRHTASSVPVRRSAITKDYGSPGSF